MLIVTCPYCGSDNSKNECKIANGCDTFSVEKIKCYHCKKILIADFERDEVTIRKEGEQESLRKCKKCNVSSNLLHLGDGDKGGKTGSMYLCTTSGCGEFNFFEKAEAVMKREFSRN